MTLDDYIEDVASILGLGHWTIHLLIEDIPEENEHLVMGEMIKTPGRHVAVMRLNKLLFEEEPFDFRHYIVHELLHLHIEKLFRHLEAIRKVFSQQRGSIVWMEAAMETARLDMEEVTDRLASVAEPLVPLPSRQVYFLRGNDTKETRAEA